MCSIPSPAFVVGFLTLEIVSKITRPSFVVKPNCPVADKYDVSAEESAERANQRVRKAAEDAFRDTVIGYDSVTPEDTRIQLKGGKTHYALFPVWLLSTTWKGNHYLFGMNGQTGKFVGNLPVDKGIFTKWFLGLTAGFSVAAYAIAWLIHTFC